MEEGGFPRTHSKPPTAPPSPKKCPKRILRSNLSLTESVWLRWCLRFGLLPMAIPTLYPFPAVPPLGPNVKSDSPLPESGKSRKVLNVCLYRQAQVFLFWGPVLAHRHHCNPL